MTSEQLKHFLSTCKYMSFTIAADHLFLHPTSISRSVSTLEKEIGVNLFERKHRGLRLTEAGEFFAKEAEYILNAMENAAHQARNLNTQTGSKLTIRLVQNMYIATYGLFKEFLKKYPNANIDLGLYMPVDGLDVCRQLDDGTIDLYFGYSDNIPSFSASNYNIRKVRTDSVGVVVGKTHRFHGRKSVSLADLQGEVVYSSDYHDYGIARTVSAAMENMGYMPSNYARTLSENELLLLVSTGKGISFMVTAPDVSSAWDCEVIPFSDFEYKKNFYMIWLNNNPNPTLRSFLECSREVELDP